MANDKTDMEAFRNLSFSFSFYCSVPSQSGNSSADVSVRGFLDPRVLARGRPMINEGVSFWTFAIFMHVHQILVAAYEINPTE
jgi:hypothetical protein